MGQRSARRRVSVIEPPPPGETGRELTGDAAFEAMHRALLDISVEPRVTLALRDIDVQKLGRWVVLKVRYRHRPDNEVTVRISRAWAAVLRNRLNVALGK